MSQTSQVLDGHGMVGDARKKLAEQQPAASAAVADPGDPVGECEMYYQPPFDFAWCEVHDTTFPLGESCRFENREMWEVYAEDADRQRLRAVRAEHERDLLEDDIRRLRNEHLSADGEPLDPEHARSFIRGVAALPPKRR